MQQISTKYQNKKWKMKFLLKKKNKMYLSIKQLKYKKKQENLI